jgi:hypothetical protein
MRVVLPREPDNILTDHRLAFDEKDLEQMKHHGKVLDQSSSSVRFWHVHRGLNERADQRSLPSASSQVGIWCARAVLDLRLAL